MATRVAIRMAIMKKRKEDVSRLTMISTKTSPTAYVTVAAFPPSSFLPKNPSLKKPFLATKPNDFTSDLLFPFNRNNKNQGLKVNGDFTRPNNGIKAAAASIFTPSEKELIDEDGWTLVTRRRRVTKSNPVKKSSIKKSWPKLKGHHADLFTLGKCFRCLQKGHKSMYCKNQRRCFNCQGTNHLFKNCKLRASSNSINSVIKKDSRFMHGTKEEDKQTREAFRSWRPIKRWQQGTQKIPHHFRCKLENMATPPNWQSIPMQDPANIQGRVNELRVYLPPREEMAEENQFLVRSAIVFTGPHYNDRHLAHRLANVLGRYFGIPQQNFRVSEIDPSIGDFIATFPNPIMRDEAVRVGVFTLDRDAEVQLVEWTEELTMIHEPTTHRARIRLHGVPLQYWNKEDLSDLVSGFGYLVRVAPFFDNGNYEILRVLINCHDPANIPKNILLTDDPNSTIVQVELEGYMLRAGNIPPPPPPPPNMGNPPPPPPPPSNQSSDSRRIIRTNRRQPTYNSQRFGQGGHFGASSSSYPNRRCPVQINGDKKVMEGLITMGNGEDSGVKEKFMNGQVTMQSLLILLMGSVILNAMFYNKEAKIQTSNQGVNVDVGNSGELARISWSAKRLHNSQNSINGGPTNQLGHVSLPGPVIEELSDSPTSPVFEELSLPGPVIEELSDSPTNPINQAAHQAENPTVGQTLHAVGEEEWFSYLNNLAGLDDKDKEGKGLSISFANATVQQQVMLDREEEGFVLSAQDEQILNRDEGGDIQMPMADPENRNKEILQENLLEQSARIEEGQTDCNQPRRSERLSSKNKGVYVSSLQKAQITQGYTGDASSQKQSKKRKIKSNLKNEEYMQSTNPLTIEHAEAVVFTAEIQISDELQKEIEESLKKDAHQGT